jgi:hypothetical protein
MQRRPLTHTKSLKDRLLEEAKRLAEEAKLLPHGPLREAVTKRARQAEIAAHMDDWLASPGLRPPKDDPAGPN